MNKTETGEIRRSNVRARMYQPAAMLVHGIASMLAKNAGALMAVSGIVDAVPLIHGREHQTCIRRGGACEERWEETVHHSDETGVIRRL